MTFLVDTNVLVRLEDSLSPQHAEAMGAIEILKPARFYTAKSDYSKPVLNDAPIAVAEPPPGDFAAALFLIATHPLSDAEKAEAVRRLMKKGEEIELD